MFGQRQTDLGASIYNFNPKFVWLYKLWISLFQTSPFSGLERIPLHSICWLMECKIHQSHDIRYSTHTQSMGFPSQPCLIENKPQLLWYIYNIIYMCVPNSIPIQSPWNPPIISWWGEGLLMIHPIIILLILIICWWLINQFRFIIVSNIFRLILLLFWLVVWNIFYFSIYWDE